MNLIKSKIRWGLDIDDCILEFWNPYCKRFPKPNQSDFEITKNVRKLCFDKDFWVNLPELHRPDFEIELFCTKRINPKQYTREWLIKHDFQVKPIYQQYYQYGSKSKLIKGRVDCFIDDSIKNVIELNTNGIPCLLMDSPANQSYGPIGRVYSLDYEEVMDIYEMFMYQIFPYYKDYINESFTY